MGLSHDPAISLLGVETGELKAETRGAGESHTHVPRTMSLRHQKAETTQVSVGGRVDKESAVSAHSGISHSREKEKGPDASCSTHGS